MHIQLALVQALLSVNKSCAPLITSASEHFVSPRRFVDRSLRTMFYPNDYVVGADARGSTRALLTALSHPTCPVPAVWCTFHDVTKAMV